MSTSFALATITPSGNRVVEQVTQAMCMPLQGFSTQFSRIPVYGDTGGATGYDWARMVDAATLLSHAKPDVICWNGSKGGVLGFDIDKELCSRITDATGVTATTAALSTLDAFAALDISRIALVTPYDSAYQAKCIKAFADRGIETVSEKHSNLTDNFSYCQISEAEIAAMTRAALKGSSAQAVVYFCTNFAGASVAPIIEAEFDVTVLDSTALGIWGAMKAGGYDTHKVKGWGKLFSL